ncbi:MAG: signal peptidase I [Prevotellaceae bacterium]|jgi:signal peptidase I|nr:signal peptidase I [Prevotellaceae bacterium]
MENTDINYKPRKIWKALLFSLLMFGVGQIYNGQIKKAIILFICLVFVPLIAAITKLSTTFYGNIIVYTIFIAIMLFAIIDACLNAKKQKNYVAKKYNKWYFHLIFGIIIFFGAWLFFKSPLSPQYKFVRHFQIPTTANAPTIQLNDYVVADMQAFKNANPDYGDIVIFSINDELHAFRIVGKPNDTLSIKDNFLIINNNLLKYSLHNTENFAKYYDEYEEELPNGHKHLIWKYLEFSNEKADIEIIIIPNDCYFVMGDNRDDAFDSRYLGVITKEQIKGKATCLIGNNFKRNIDLTKN